MTDKPQKINQLFTEAKRRFILWLKGKPTGDFSVKISVNEGGLRDKEEYNYREKG